MTNQVSALRLFGALLACVLLSGCTLFPTTSKKGSSGVVSDSHPIPSSGITATTDVQNPNTGMFQDPRSQHRLPAPRLPDGSVAVTSPEGTSSSEIPAPPPSEPTTAPVVVAAPSAPSAPTTIQAAMGGPALDKVVTLPLFASPSPETP